MAIETNAGGISITGKRDVDFYRLATLVHGLRFEQKTGMKLTRGPKCSTILRREFGLKGNPAKLLAAAEALLENVADAREGLPENEYLPRPEKG